MVFLVNKQWLAITLIGWVIIVACSWIIPLPTLATKFIWMALQQAWLILAGLKAIQPKKLMQFELAKLFSGIRAGLVLFVLNTAISYVVVLILSLIFGMEEVLMVLANERSGIGQLFAVKNQITLVIVFFLVVIGAPVSEEIVFRGGLLQGLAQVTSARVANFITALIFALVHYYVIQFLPVFFSGLYLGWIYLKRENLVEPIAAHATVNFIGFMFNLFI